MSSARGLANLSIYHAAVQQRLLAAELAREDVPAHILLEGIGRAIQLHLREAYGWFLVELAGLDELPLRPPLGVRALQELLPDSDVGLRGELVELGQLETKSGWLCELLGDPRSTSTRAAVPADSLSVAVIGWDQQQLEQWSRGVTGLIERMSDSLEEW